jgi:hypothetical protein
VETLAEVVAGERRGRGGGGHGAAGQEKVGGKWRGERGVGFKWMDGGDGVGRMADRTTAVIGRPLRGLGIGEQCQRNHQASGKCQRWQSDVRSLPGPVLLQNCEA